MGAQRRCPHRLLHHGVALLFVGTLYLTAHASASARQTLAAMPTLRLDYESHAGIQGGAPGLAASLDPVHISDPFDYELSSLLINANLVHILPDDNGAGPCVDDDARCRVRLHHEFAAIGHKSGGSYAARQAQSDGAEVAFLGRVHAEAMLRESVDRIGDPHGGVGLGTGGKAVELVAELLLGGLTWTASTGWPSETAYARACNAARSSTAIGTTAKLCTSSGSSWASARRSEAAGASRGGATPIGESVCSALAGRGLSAWRAD